MYINEMSNGKFPRNGFLGEHSVYSLDVRLLYLQTSNKPRTDMTSHDKFFFDKFILYIKSHALL